MSRESTIAAGRRFAEGGFIDSCTIRRTTGESTDPLTGIVTPTWTAVYAGRCRIQSGGGSSPGGGSPGEVGQAHVALLGLVVQLPVVGSEGIEVGDEVTVTTATLDADLVGRVLRVTSQAYKTHATARRLQCEEVTS